MEINKDIQNKIENTFNAIDALESVNVSPFLKNRIMQRLYTEKEEQQTIWSWFAPQLQLATLACVVILNVFALTQLDLSANSNNLDEFSQVYDLTESNNYSIFN